jgi:hypothetical protein
MDRRQFRFRDDGEDLALCRGCAVLLRIVADERFPGLWRVRHHDSRLTDMADIARPKDAAISTTLASLNVQEAAA